VEAQMKADAAARAQYEDEYEDYEEAQPGEA
jgi:hypothetical protein